MTDRYYPIEAWKPICDRLYDLCEKEGIEVLEVKEKFGGLRFYVGHNTTMEILETIHKAEQQTMSICQVCGQPGKLRYRSGWYVTLCDEHEGA